MCFSILYLTWYLQDQTCPHVLLYLGPATQSVFSRSVITSCTIHSSREKQNLYIYIYIWFIIMNWGIGLHSYGDWGVPQSWWWCTSENQKVKGLSWEQKTDVWAQAVRQRVNTPLLFPSIEAFTGVDDAHPCWRRQSSLFCSPVKMLISSGNTLIEKHPEVMFNLGATCLCQVDALKFIFPFQ